MDISQFLFSVSTDGFTRACNIHNINRELLKEMCVYIHEFDSNAITPFNTKQQIVYYYIALKLENLNL